MQIKLADHIIENNKDWIALDKPAGLLSIPDRMGKEISLKSILQEKYGSIFTVHRLDKETSGLIVFARNEQSHKFLSKQFEERQTRKIYQGLVIGTPANPEDRIELPIAEHPAGNGTMMIHRNGKSSITDYKLLDDFGIYSWMEFRIHTGRTHQIRVHMKEIGHPIVCDPLYGDGKPLLLSSIKSKFKLSKNDEEERPLLNRLALHSHTLGFTGMNGSPIELNAPLPRDLRAVLQQLNKRKQKKRV